MQTGNHSLSAQAPSLPGERAIAPELPHLRRQEDWGSSIERRIRANGESDRGEKFVVDFSRLA
jgi:hypothetical protein